MCHFELIWKVWDKRAYQYNTIQCCRYLYTCSTSLVRPPPPLKQSYFNSFHHIVLIFGCIIYKSISPHRNTICFKVHDFVTSLMHLIGCIRHKCFSLHRNTFCFKELCTCLMHLERNSHTSTVLLRLFHYIVITATQSFAGLNFWCIIHKRTRDFLFQSAWMTLHAPLLSGAVLWKQSYEHISAATERDMRAM